MRVICSNSVMMPESMDKVCVWKFTYSNANTVIYVRLRLVRIRPRLLSHGVLRPHFDWRILCITAY